MQAWDLKFFQKIMSIEVNSLWAFFEKPCLFDAIFFSTTQFWSIFLIFDVFQKETSVWLQSADNEELAGFLKWRTYYLVSKGVITLIIIMNHAQFLLAFGPKNAMANWLDFQANKLDMNHLFDTIFVHD